MLKHSSLNVKHSKLMLKLIFYSVYIVQGYDEFNADDKFSIVITRHYIRASKLKFVFVRRAVYSVSKD